MSDSKIITNQLIFDTVVEHLRKQKVQCVDIDGVCKYRKDNLKCAAGALIPDNMYDPIIEGGSLFTEHVRHWFMTKLGYNITQMQLIRSLQIVHDNSNGPDAWEVGFASVAYSWGLHYAPPTP